MFFLHKTCEYFQGGISLLNQQLILKGIQTDRQLLFYTIIYRYLLYQ